MFGLSAALAGAANASKSRVARMRMRGDNMAAPLESVPYFAGDSSKVQQPFSVNRRQAADPVRVAVPAVDSPDTARRVARVLCRVAMESLPTASVAVSSAAAEVANRVLLELYCEHSCKFLRLKGDRRKGLQITFRAGSPPSAGQDQSSASEADPSRASRSCTRILASARRRRA